jgi:hypothetical protein
MSKYRVALYKKGSREPTHGYYDTKPEAKARAKRARNSGRYRSVRIYETE